jgi:hypothetical protein
MYIYIYIYIYMLRGEIVKGDLTFCKNQDKIKKHKTLKLQRVKVDYVDKL